MKPRHETPRNSSQRSQSKLGRVTPIVRTPKSPIKKTPPRPKSYKFYTENEFRRMLSPPRDIKQTIQDLANGIFELGLDIRDFLETLAQIVIFKKRVPLSMLNFDGMVLLLTTAQECPQPDVAYLILAISAYMVQYGMDLSSKDQRELISKATELLEPNHIFISFEDKQELPRQYLQEMIEIFRGNIPSRPSPLGFDIVEQYIMKREKRLLPPPNLESEIPNSSSIDDFITNKSTLASRIEHGTQQIDVNSPEMRKVSKFLDLFTSWEVAYSASNTVWNAMKANDDVNLDLLLSLLPFTYAEFLLEALREFAHDDGYDISLPHT